MSAALLIAVEPGEARAALVEDGAPVALGIARDGMASLVGVCFLGRVLGINAGLGGAQVEIGLPRPAFLSAEDAAPRRGLADLTEGQAVLVQAIKDARADKAAGVSLRPRLAGRFVELRPGTERLSAARGLDASQPRFAGLPEAGEGLYLRREAGAASDAAIAAELAALRARWQRIAAARQAAAPPARLEPAPPLAATLAAEFADAAPERVLVNDRAAFAELRAWLGPALALAGADWEFDAGWFDAALAPRVPLPGGGALIIEPAAAATLIDVDGGPAAALAANLAAAQAAAREIVLRNLAGPIVIDFITMKQRGERDTVRAALTAALASDPAQPELLGWTRLGHFELARKRRRPAVHELLQERAGCGGWRKTALTVALEALAAARRAADAQPAARLALHAAPEIADCLGEGPAGPARRALEARLGRALALVREPAFARDRFDIRAA